MTEADAGPAVRVLGPAAAPGALVVRLLAALALAGPDGRSAEGLVDDVWEDDPPRSPRGALQMLVSRARAALPEGAIASTATGYRLPDSDLERLERAAVAARADPDRAVGIADAALGLVHGEPEVPPGPLADALVERASAAEDALRAARAAGLAAAGRFADAAADLAALAARRPFDADVVRALLAALRDDGRVPEALAAYAGYAERLADALGADPPPAVTALHAELLREGDGGETVGLRAPTDALLGRDGDLAAIAASVRANRLTTIVGPGGLGKTRLAQETGLRLAPSWARVVFVELAGATTAADVPLVIGTAVGARAARAARRLGEAPPPAERRTREVLSDRRTLLVLDNCEQVVEAVAREVADLLGAVPSLTVLTTSRVPLLLGGEHLVAPAPLPPATDGARLFTVRAEAARPGVRLDPDRLVRVCERLDGLPLAIELAAARVRSMSLEELETRLDDRFGLLVGGDRTAPQRHRTLLAVIEWSWNLLAPEAQAALATLAVFPDGFTAASAGALLGRSAAVVLEDLVDQSLLELREAEGAAPRFRMLETVREFGLRALAERGEAAAARAALDGWVRGFAAEHLDGLTGGRDVRAVRAVGAEEETLLAVLRDRGPDEAETVLAAFALLGEWWVLRAEFGTLLANAGAVVPAVQTPAGAAAWTAPRALLLAVLALGVGESPLAPRALALLRRAARRDGMGPGFWPEWVRLLADVRSVDGLRDAARVASRSADPLVACFGSIMVSQLLENDGRIDESRREVARALRVAEAEGFAWYRLIALTSTAQLRAQQADWAGALALGLSVRDDLLAFDARADTRTLDWLLGMCETGVGRLEAAEARFAGLLQGAARPNDLDVDDMRAVSLAGLAEAAEAAGNAALADERWAAARARRNGSPWTALVAGAAVAARARRGALAPGEARRLRVLLLVLARLPREGGLDRSIFAAGLLGLSVAADRALGADLARLALRLGARREFPSLAAAARGVDPGDRRDDDLQQALALLRSPQALRM